MLRSLFRPSIAGLLLLSLVGSLPSEPLLEPVSNRVAERLRSPAQPAPKVIVPGKIRSIELSPGEFPQFQGRMTVDTGASEPVVFRVYEYSLILIRHQGRLWAGRLDQLQPGWPVSAVYLEDDQGNLGGDGEWFLDNCIADYPGSLQDLLGPLPPWQSSEASAPSGPGPEVTPATRGFVAGTIQSLSLSPGELPSLEGRLVVSREEGEPLVLRVRTFSLILIDDGGRLYAGHLRQLRPGWRIEAGFDAENETGLGGDGEFHMLNCIVVYPGSP